MRRMPVSPSPPQCRLESGTIRTSLLDVTRAAFCARPSLLAWGKRVKILDPVVNKTQLCVNDFFKPSGAEIAQLLHLA